jgi:hypothetical protein
MIVNNTKLYCIYVGRWHNATYWKLLNNRESRGRVRERNKGGYLSKVHIFTIKYHRETPFNNEYGLKNQRQDYKTGPVRGRYSCVCGWGGDEWRVNVVDGVLYILLWNRTINPENVLFLSLTHFPSIGREACFIDTREHMGLIDYVTKAVQL